MRNIFPWILVLLWMAVIFCLSHQPAEQSNELSTGITEIIIEKVERIAPQAKLDLERINHVVRKNAHFFAYLLLGVLVLFALKGSGVREPRSLLLAFFICVVYAISDETHQMFVPGRGPGVKDVLIDSSGAAVGIGLAWGVRLLFRSRKYGDGRKSVP